MNKNSEQDIKFFEQELKKLKFKKVWFGDKSGYWYELHRKFLDFKIMFTVEPERDIFTLGVITGEWTSGSIKFNKHYDDVATYSCNLKTIKKALDKYK